MTLRLTILLSFLCSLSLAVPNPSSTSRLSDYQLQVIDYFKEVALGFEYGSAAQITRKWHGAMNIYIDGNPSLEVSLEIEKVVQELNSLITDDFEISIVSDPKESNLHLFVGSIAEYTAIYPQDYRLAKPNSGVFTVSWNSRNEIVKGRIFIKNNIPLQEQRHAVREELTQTLGFGRDSLLYPESIFQLKYTTPTQYAEIDKEVIRLLYHPRMRCGLSAPEVETLLTEILLGEQQVADLDLK